MNLVSLRIITSNIQRLVTFYEQALGFKATWFTEDFAELNTPNATLAIGSVRTLSFFGHDIAQPEANRSAIIEFLVEDVDARLGTLKGLVDALVQEPTTMPWGNRSLLLRDPDGNLINFFTPVTEQARKKFGLVA